MKKIVILGAGTAGTIMLNKLNSKIDKSKWQLTIIDMEKIHYYQPGFLFIPFDLYKKEDIYKPVDKFFPKNIQYINSQVNYIHPDKNKVILDDNSEIDYDILIIATGSVIRPDDTPGLMEDHWHKSIFDFYTMKGCSLLGDFLKNWQGGKLVINVTEMPIKCPVAPIEMALLTDWYFTAKGMRDKVDIHYVTPLSGAFTKPKASSMLGNLFRERNINLITEFNIERLDNENKELVSYDDIKVPFDLLITTPVNMGSDVIERSGIGDELNFVLTHKHTLQSKEFENIFIIGDATDLPSSKAGSVAHFQAHTLSENILSYINGGEMKAKFDGHSNCFIVSGYDKSILIDFNYETEPLPGVYPYPVIGPMSLLKETKLNFLGKKLFKWVYWNILLKARPLPVTTHMSMAGKKQT